MRGRLLPYTAAVRRVRFIVVFLLLLALFEIPLLLDPVDRHVIRPFTAGIAAVSASALRLVGEPVRSAGTIIAGSCFAVDIQNGCNAVEATLFVIAAVLAFPATWKSRLGAVLAGSAILQVANLVRIVTLYLIGCHRRQWFQSFHLAVWQSIIFALAIGFFLIWSRRAKLVHAG